ncbi:hypothetical protein M0R45_033668 [Rubus argutus]|uniref:Uncharacterized protein n=1 Tax=Rubus argutus TaxID=59490 RepID=A0AAW1WN41_RUBAR
MDVNVRVFDHLLDEHHVELVGSSDDELELAPEPQIRAPKPNRKIEVNLLAPQPIVPVGVPVPEPEPEPDAEADAVNNLLCEIPESVDFLPSGLNAKELGFATIPVIKGESEEEDQIGMGIYLSTPKTDKFSEDGGENGWVRYGLSSMQGWRATMEGRSYPDLDPSTSFFGVYGGKICEFNLSVPVLED